MSEGKYVVLHANYGKWGLKNGTFRKFFVGGWHEFDLLCKARWNDKQEYASLFNAVKANYIARKVKKSKECHWSDTVLVIPYDNLTASLPTEHNNVPVVQNGSDWVCRSIDPTEEGLYWVETTEGKLEPAHYQDGLFQNMAGTDEGRRCWGWSVRS